MFLQICRRVKDVTKSNFGVLSSSSMCYSSDSGKKTEGMKECSNSENIQKGNTKVVPTVGVDKNKEDGLYQRPIRMEPGKVRLGFMPVEWFDFFMPKTGVTGCYTLMFTVSTYLVSKEIYVLEHNYYNGLSMLIIWTSLCKVFGKKLGTALDKLIDEYEHSYSKYREHDKAMYKDGIKHEGTQQWSFMGQQILVDAKRENVKLQLEAEYRKRLGVVYTGVKKRLDYQVDVGLLQNRFVHKNIVSWVVRQVETSLTPEVLNKYMDKCIDDLDVLIKKIK